MWGRVFHQNAKTPKMTVASASNGFREKVHPLNMMVFSFLYGEPIMFSEILKTISLHAVQKRDLGVGSLTFAANVSLPTLRSRFGATHHVPGLWGKLDIFVRIFRDHHQMMASANAWPVVPN